MIRYHTGVYSTQGRGALFTLHIGFLALYFGHSTTRTGPRLELFTHDRRFRWHRGYSRPAKREVAA